MTPSKQIAHVQALNMGRIAADVDGWTHELNNKVAENYYSPGGCSRTAQPTSTTGYRPYRHTVAARISRATTPGCTHRHIRRRLATRRSTTYHSLRTDAVVSGSAATSWSSKTFRRLAVTHPVMASVYLAAVQDVYHAFRLVTRKRYYH